MVCSLAARLIFRRHVHDAVRVDVERHLDLRQAARRRRNADEVELSQQFVVGRHLAFALEDADGNRGLIVFRGREGLAPLGRDRGVALDELGHDAAERLDPERQRRDVEQQDILDVALEDAGLDGSADRDHLVRVHALVRLPSEQFLHGFLHLGHAGLAADQDDLVDLGRLQAGVLQCGLAGADCPLDEIVDQRFELGTGQFHVEMLGSVLIGGDERKIDVGLRRARQLDLGLLGRILEALQGQAIVAQIDAVLLAELVRQIVHDALVEVLAAEEGVAVGRLDLEHAVAHLEDGDVERAAAEIVDGDLAAPLLVQAVGQRSRRRLVDDAKHVEAGNAARVLGRLALGVVEIGGNRDDRLFDLVVRDRLPRSPSSS